MFTEEEFFALPSRNAKYCICSYATRNGPGLLLVNSAQLLSLRAGLGPAGDRYGLQHVPAVSVPADVELVACTIVPTRRSGPSRRGAPGMVCLVMRADTADTSMGGGEAKQGDAAGGPAARSYPLNGAAGSPTYASAPAKGILNVYPMGGERRFEVEKALQRQPQQLQVGYIPMGITHVTVWRALPTEAHTYASAPPPTSSGERIEHGDALLVWDQYGVVHGYTRWEEHASAVNGLAGASRGPSSSGTHVVCESRDSLAALLPELAGVGPVLGLAASTVEERNGCWRRDILAGCMDGVFSGSFDATSRKQTSAFSSVDGSVPAVALKPFHSPRPRQILPHGRDAATGEVVGFACGQLGMMASLLRDDRVGQERTEWSTEGTSIANNDHVMCITCADFCRNGSTSVAIGTRLGKVMIHETVPHVWDAHGAPLDTDADSSDGGFGASCIGDESPVREQWSRRGESISPRPSGLERQHVFDRAPANGTLVPRISLAPKWFRGVRYTVLGIAFEDFNYDGIDEMVVGTQYGLHIFRPDYREEANRLAKTLDALKSLQPREAISVEDTSDDDSGISLIGNEVHHVDAIVGNKM